MRSTRFTPPGAFDRRSWLRATAAGLAGLGTVAGRTTASGPGPRVVGAAGRQGRGDPFPGRLHDPAVFPLPARPGTVRDRGGRLSLRGLGHDAPRRRRDEPVLAPDASPDRAKELGTRCRDLGLEPVMMFSGVYPEADDAPAVLRARIVQAGAAGVPQVLTFGHTKGGNRKLWVERFKALGPVARDHGVTVVVKQHGGETGTGAACAAIVREVDDEGIKVNYDAGNVMDYLDVDPIPDVEGCAAEVRSFCIKDHRNFPKDQDCGPGFGEIDHYRLLHPVAFTGRAMPLCCENISAPLLPAPDRAEGGRRPGPPGSRVPGDRDPGAASLRDTGSCLGLAGEGREVRGRVAVCVRAVASANLPGNLAPSHIRPPRPPPPSGMERGCRPSCVRRSGSGADGRPGYSGCRPPPSCVASPLRHTHGGTGSGWAPQPTMGRLCLHLQPLRAGRPPRSIRDTTTPPPAPPSRDSSTGHPAG